MAEWLRRGTANPFTAVRFCLAPQRFAAVVEQGDTIDLRSIAARRVGSTPTRGTYKKQPEEAAFVIEGLVFHRKEY